ncbi:exodeoxyribonuclease V subunit gamma [Simonsiella muelleri]|uniref:RecBCD enzyme subunit RecC n=1 Tax=Simonsiella muelleri ATCC 29453 TaxID=641147 RepID=V9H7P7_9NEIS|nr:exodeoxyribonuclease V subunit gamma [Simonsiella muelleri]AUX60960.1 exodeoxyribonuclease V subunit gamma [Simonsiella muelleri ATCC 29453]EFG30259.1 exodeoxyribonuclease V, gamma subunit [Simonsiella muelleri ATCC 29453]UBQ53003.1 exodeoxyribonuclease V subunit gamma [Simonsiella muelleri]
MLHLYQSNRLEDLAEMLATLHAVQPVPSSFAPEQIVVQSQGMRRFINQYLAKKQGIAANIQFSLPAGFSFRLMRETMPDTPELNPFDTEVMRWRLLDLFQSDEFQQDEFQAARTVLHTYLQNGDYAAYQLAGQLADVFDQYLVYRPNWIETWHKGQLVDGLSDEQIWQAPLWRYLDDGRQTAPHRVQLWYNLMNILDNPPDWLPERFFVFGIATLAPMYLELLIRLSKMREVHIFALNPSAEYWGQVIEPSQILDKSEILDLSLQGHPLLASLGKQGRDFFDALAEADVAVDVSAYDDEYFSGSLLHQLQRDIQTQTLPENSQWREINQTDSENSLDYLKHHDRSIQIHSAHSPLRELQILKDQLLELLDKNPNWRPHDIAVLTPHIEPYAPYLQAVFGQETGSGQALPYSLSDVKLSRQQPFLYALEQVLDLLTSRFEVDKLLGVLDNEIILQKFDLTKKDLPLIHDTVAKLNIHWGANSEQRAQFGDRQRLFTWQQGLERIVLGWMLPENTRQSLWQGMSPWYTRPDYLEILSKFVLLIRVLTKSQQKWQKPADVAIWTERLRELVNQLFLPNDEDRDVIQKLEQSLSEWIAESELAHFHHNLSPEVVIQHIKRFLNQSDEAGFLRGGITFCGMVPMRSLPFKVIALIGLNDGDFPRNTKAASFDLIAKHPKKGDRARRDDDRYLFLEALFSARDVLYLSFVGKDIRTDEVRAPSTLLNELVDCVADMAGVSSGLLLSEWVVAHPLQAFSRQYFISNKSDNLIKSVNYNELISSRTDYADALNQPVKPLGDFFRQPEKLIHQSDELIEQNSFIQFWRNPIRSYLRDSLNWQPPYLHMEWDAKEPFEPTKIRLLSDAYVLARRKNQSFEELAQELTAQSLLPTGVLGKLVQRDFAAQAAMLDGELLHSPALAERSGMLHMESGSLNYRLNHLTQCGQMIYASQFLRESNEHGKLSASDKIELILQHLIFCAATPDNQTQTENRQTYLIQLPDVLTFPAVSQDEALTILNIWIKYYKQGINSPLPFFPRVQLAAANKLFDPKTGQLNREAAIKKAAEIYHKGYQGFAQEDYPEVKLVYGRNPDAEPPYLSDEFINLTIDLFENLQGSLKALEGKLENDEVEQ